MSYFKKHIKIIIIIVCFEFTSGSNVLESIRNFGSKLLCTDYWYPKKFDELKVLESLHNFGSKVNNLLFCNEYCHPKKFDDLKDKLTSDVFGQPFVTFNLMPELGNYYTKKQNEKSGPLVFSFYGPSGVGKSYVADIISTAPFIKNYHYFSSKSVDFNDIYDYAAELNKIIDSSIYNCKKSMFVFDDADNLPPKLMNMLNAFTDKNSNLNYKESIFIFIFQVGSEQIVYTTSQLLDKGFKRSQLNIEEFRDLINTSADNTFKDNIFFKQFNNIIPFLPLEKVHIEHFLKLKNNNNDKQSDKDIKKVLDETEYYPGTYLIKTGCKLAQSKLHLVRVKNTEL